MRDYGRVQSRFWQSPDIKQLDETAKLLALYLLTSPHANLVGCYYLPIDYIVADTRNPSERVREGLRKLENAGFCRFDQETEWIWVCRYVFWNSFENPNVQKAAIKVVGQVPRSVCFYDDFLSTMRSDGAFSDKLLDALPQPSENPSETLSKPFANSTPTPEPTPTPKPIPPSFPPEGEGGSSDLFCSRDETDQPAPSSRPPPSTSKPSPSEFEDWYAAYPRRVGRGKAERAYRQARRTASAETLLAGAKAYAALCRAKETEAQYIAHPATWLNGQRWTDEDLQEASADPDPVDRRAFDRAVRDWEANGMKGPAPAPNDFRRSDTNAQTEDSHDTLH